jgi:predicted Zn-dependent peptidase
MTMALMELYGLGWDDFSKYPAMVKQVTALEIKKSAADFFNPEAMLKVLVG